MVCVCTCVFLGGGTLDLFFFFFLRLSLVGTGPSLMAYEERNRTPGVSFGDKFVVAVQFVLIKEGPDKVGGKCAHHDS